MYVCIVWGVFMGGGDERDRGIAFTRYRISDTNNEYRVQTSN